MTKDISLRFQSTNSPMEFLKFQRQKLAISSDINILSGQWLRRFFKQTPQLYELSILHKGTST